MRGPGGHVARDGRIAEIGPARATVFIYVNPAVAAILGVAILGEQFTLGMGVGFVLVLIGSILASRRSPDSSSAPVPSLAAARDPI